MTQGFYEQLGCEADATPETLRQAYHRQVARLTKRMRQLREQRGDTAQIELARVQLDEAWAVVSHPSRRQRYDLMLRFLEADVEPGLNADGLWAQVGADLVPPSTAAATRLVAKATKLAVEPIGKDVSALPSWSSLPEPATPTLAPPTAVPITSVTEAPTELGATGPSLAMPTPNRLPSIPTAPVVAAPKAGLKVVDGAASPVLLLKPNQPSGTGLSADRIQQLTDQHGYTGALLQAAREAQGISLDQVGQTTRISLRYLQAIESDAHERLPSATFVKGYVREIARMLGLDDETVVAGYMRRLQG